jgi:lipoprotein NlpD
VSSAGHPGRCLAFGWLALAACASGRTGQATGELPSWAKSPAAQTHPEPEVVRGIHRVEKGETLFHIAKRYGLSAEELAEANGLEVTAALSVGTELLIPGALDSASGPSPQAERAATEAPRPGVAKVWETAVEPRGGQALPPELLRAFEGGGKAPADMPLPPELARAFEHPTAPLTHPLTAAPSNPPGPAEKSSAVAASIGPAPSSETAAPRASSVAARTAVMARGSLASTPAGVLQWPLRGVLYARFGKKGREPHDGIDLAAPAGTPVRTAGEGVVLFAGPQSGYGLIVIVSHEKGLVTVYAHSRDLRVRTGQTVRPGQVIATVGESGKTSGPHLHFEVRVEGEPVDPMRFLGPVPAP